MLAKTLDTGGVAVVTGGASGIGREVVIRLVNNKVRTAVLDVAKFVADGNAPLASALSEGTLLPIHCDVGSRGDVENALATLERHWPPPQGRITFLFNNAGISSPLAFQKNFLELSEVEWRRIFHVNVFGALNVLQVFVPPILKIGAAALETGCHAHVVTTCSIASIVPTGASGYTVSKAADLVMAELLDRHLQQTGPEAEHIRTHTLHPSTVYTGIWDGMPFKEAIGKKWGSTPSQVVDAMMLGLDESVFCIMVDDKGDTPMGEQLRTRTEDLISGRRPRMPILPAFFQQRQPQPPRGKL